MWKAPKPDKKSKILAPKTKNENYSFFTHGFRKIHSQVENSIHEEEKWNLLIPSIKTVLRMFFMQQTTSTLSLYVLQ